MKGIFDSLKIGTIDIPNRFMRSATNENLANEHGVITDSLIAFYKDLAKGGIGLIIPGFSYVLPEGRSGKKQGGIYSDDLIDGYSRLVKTIKSSGSKTFLQIVHGGRQSAPQFNNLPAYVPSVIDKNADSEHQVELDDEKITSIIAAFAEAAARAKAAGFDGVQIHAAHGFLLSNFISSFTNRRKDKWGGSVENRCRIIKEVVSGIRKECGSIFPVSIKINSEDGISNGMSLMEGAHVFEYISKLDIDMFEISGGIRDAGFFACRDNIHSEENEAYFENAAKYFRKSTNKVIALVGGIRSRKVMQRIINDGTADMISLSRPFIREPNLVNELRKGAQDKAKCISCNGCFNPDGIRCVFNQ